MRSLNRLADKLVNRLAPKTSAAAACPVYECLTAGCFRTCCSGKPCGPCVC